MSRENGACRFGDGKVLFFLYDGTIDRCYPRLYDTPSEAWATYLAGTSPRFPPTPENALQTKEIVEIVTLYGPGMHWIGTASRSERFIVTGLSPFERNMDGTQVVPEEGLPSWAVGLWENT